MKLITAVFLTVLTLAVPNEVRAATILPHCGTCGSHNTTWDLSLALLEDANNIYSVTITATYGSPVDFVFVNSVAFKIDAFTNNYEDVPTATGPAEDLWNAAFGGISNSSGTGDCNGSGNGYWCAQSIGKGATHGGAGSTDTWIFTLNLFDAFPNLSAGAVGSLKASFADASGAKIGSLLSEDVTFTTPTTPPITSAPEPASLLLLGTGLAALATAYRRHRRKLTKRHVRTA